MADMCAPVPHGVTGAEMIEWGKPEAVWPARWKAPNKNQKETAHPPSTRARVPAKTIQDGDGRNQAQRRRYSARSDTRDRTSGNQCMNSMETQHRAVRRPAQRPAQAQHLQLGHPTLSRSWKGCENISTGWRPRVAWPKRGMQK